MNEYEEKRFVPVAKTWEFRNNCKVVFFRQREVGIFRHGDEYFAIDNLCPHRQAALSLGEVEDGVVVCPYHQARFDLRTGKGLPGPHQADLTSYPVRVEGESVLLAPPVNEQQTK